MRRNFALVIILTLVFASCEKKNETDIVTFEEITLGSAGYWNGSDLSGEFASGNIRFVNHYNTQYGTWSGFACSSVTDTLTKDYTNQYSCIAKGGADLSEKYAVFYYSGVPDTLFFNVPEKITEMSLCNSVYTYNTIKYGNQFSKKFGGVTGNDQDWFKLTITAINESGNAIGIADIYLADYRNTDNTQDYIVNVWSTVDLSTFGFVSALKLELSSSDTGQLGMNTPAYFCIDNIKGILISD